MIKYTYTNNGQFANQIWSYLALDNYCAKKNIPYQWCVFEYENLTENPKPLNKLYSTCYKISKHKIYRMALRYIVKLWYELRYHKRTVVGVPLNTQIHQNALVGGMILSKKLSRKNIPKIIKNVDENKAKAFIEDVKKTTKKTRIVGIHYRRGDYRKWCKGKFFVKQEQVESIINAEYIKNPNSAFILCCDEKITLDVKAPIVYSNGTLIEDLCRLTQTQYIIGSYSTYGRLASFLGQVPFSQFETYATQKPKIIQGLSK
jgi:hypothetical protein